jgi:hypothetical protein
MKLYISIYPADRLKIKLEILILLNPAQMKQSLFYKNYFEDKTGSKVEVHNKKGKFKVVLNFNSADAIKDFVEKID